jgi:hypothetical protein
VINKYATMMKGIIMYIKNNAFFILYIIEYKHILPIIHNGHSVILLSHY